MGEPRFNYPATDLHPYLIQLCNPMIVLSQHKEMKSYLSIEKIKLGKTVLDRLIIGNFSASFGQGIVFENSDDFGYGSSYPKTIF